MQRLQKASKPSICKMSRMLGDLEDKDVIMTTLTAGEMSYISLIQQKLQEQAILPKEEQRSEVSKELIEKTKTFWEYIEKKYGIDILSLKEVTPDGTLILK